MRISSWSSDVCSSDLLGAVPAGEKPAAEIFAPMASALLLGSAAGLPRSILVTSAQEGEGKSSTLYALAKALAKLDKRVLVIDAAMRRPKQHSLFGLAPTRGKTGRASWREKGGQYV